MSTYLTDTHNQIAYNLTKKHYAALGVNTDQALAQLAQGTISVRCGDWDCAVLKASYGQDQCFHGVVDNQHTMPFGKPEDVRNEVQHLKEALGGDGTGYILTPCHNLQPITPLENILALYETAQD
jgi:uroporphyrinogen-III decarboxylase